MSQTLSIYRQILKEIHLQYTKPGNTDLYANSLRTIYKENKSVTDPVKIDALNNTASDLLTFLKSSRLHKELRERYSSIVLEQKKKIELSAKRVGLQLPKQYDPNSPAPLDGSTHEKAVTDRVNKAFSN
ncbi:hypothetical protein BJ944DRAFT_180284 [Cunninghamella echinulata]|nr:hypothetical protein BJ944DRAFT_180284 [Cunninghamella echinulata]